MAVFDDSGVCFEPNRRMLLRDVCIFHVLFWRRWEGTAMRVIPALSARITVPRLGPSQNGNYRITLAANMACSVILPIAS